MNYVENTKFHSVALHVTFTDLYAAKG